MENDGVQCGTSLLFAFHSHFLCGGGGLLFAPRAEPFHAPCRVHKLLLPGVEGVTVAANLGFDFLLSGTDNKGSATGAFYLGIRKISRMYLFLHSEIIVLTARKIARWV